MATTTTLWMLLLLQCGVVLATYYHRSSAESSSSRAYRLPTAASSYKSKSNYYQQQAPLRQAAVDVVSKSRMTHNYNDNKLSPLEVLYNKLDSQSQSSSSKQQEFSQKHTSYFSNNGKRDYVPSPMLRSAPEHRRHALQLKNEDTYDYVEEDEDVDDNEDDEDEDEEDEEEEEGEDTDVEGDHHPLRHQKHNHHSESVKIWDGEGFQDQQPSSGQSYSEFKWHIFGKENINNYRNRHRPPNRTPTPENIKRAVDHTLVMNREGACRVPKPKVVHVKAVYPHPGKAYIPHCTILHQCGDDTGCCRSETQTCTARTTQPVELYFYTQKVGSSGGSSVTNVEKLIFYNHTECSCVDRLEEVMPRDGGNSHHHHNHQTNTKPSPDPAQICRCPRMFSERQLADGTCTCECFDKQRECIRAKRGKEYLSLQDQMCVVNGHCQPPSCEFGTYKRHAGRCPRKEEKFDVWRAYPHRDEDFK